MAVLTPFFDVVAGVAILAGRSSLLDTGIFKTANNNFTVRQLLALGFIGYGGWNLWKIERAQDKLKKTLDAESVAIDHENCGMGPSDCIECGEDACIDCDTYCDNCEQTIHKNCIEQHGDDCLGAESFGAERFNGEYWHKCQDENCQHGHCPAYGNCDDILENDGDGFEDDENPFFCGICGVSISDVVSYNFLELDAESFGAEPELVGGPCEICDEDLFRDYDDSMGDVCLSCYYEERSKQDDEGNEYDGWLLNFAESFGAEDFNPKCLWCDNESMCYIDDCYACKDCAIAYVEHVEREDNASNAAFERQENAAESFEANA